MGKPAITPLAFAKKYLDTEVYLYPQELAPGVAPVYVPPKGWVKASIDNYRLGHSSWPHAFWKDISPNLKKPISLKVKTISGQIQDTRPFSAAELYNHFYNPFVGKGSPEQAQIAIQLVYRYHNVSHSLDQFLDQDFIGLDCNGFVGNYYQRVVLGWGNHWESFNNDRDPGPTTEISDLLQRQGKENQIATMKDFQPGDIYLFGLCDATGLVIDPSAKYKWGHIMITEPGTLQPLASSSFKIGVVEATHSGKRKLRNLNYQIVKATSAANGTVFDVLRGESANSDRISVRIARLADNPK